MKTKQGRKQAIYFFMVVLFWFGQNVYLPYLNPYLSSLGLTASLIGVIVGAYGFAQVLGCFSFGILADFFRLHWKLITYGELAIAIANFLGLYASNSLVFFIMRLVAGAVAATWPCCTIYFSDFACSDDAGKNMSLMLMGVCIGSLSAYIFGAFFFEYIGMQGMFFAGGTAAICAVVLLQWLKPQSHISVHGSFSILKEIKSVLCSKCLWNCAFLTALLQSIIFATSYSFISSYASDLGASVSQLAILSACHIVGCFIGASSGRFGLYHYLPVRMICALSFSILAVSCLAVPFCTNIWQLYFIQFLFGISRDAPLGILMAVAVSEIKPCSKSIAMGILQSVYSIGTTLGPMLMGTLIALFKDYLIPYIFFALVAGLGTIQALISNSFRKAGVTKKISQH